MHGSPLAFALKDTPCTKFIQIAYGLAVGATGERLIATIGDGACTFRRPYTNLLPAI